MALGLSMCLFGSRCGRCFAIVCCNCVCVAYVCRSVCHCFCLVCLVVSLCACLLLICSCGLCAAFCLSMCLFDLWCCRCVLFVCFKVPCVVCAWFCMFVNVFGRFVLLTTRCTCLLQLCLCGLCVVRFNCHCAGVLFAVALGMSAAQLFARSVLDVFVCRCVRVSLLLLCEWLLHRRLCCWCVGLVFVVAVVCALLVGCGCLLRNCVGFVRGLFVCHNICGTDFVVVWTVVANLPLWPALVIAFVLRVVPSMLVRMCVVCSFVLSLRGSVLRVIAFVCVVPLFCEWFLHIGLRGLRVAFYVVVL